MAIEFTDEQKAVLRHLPGTHARILAAPGTGKSSTVIALADHLKESGAEGVRLVTFTRAASAELADKVLEAGAANLETSTIHAFAISLLLSNPGTGSFPEPLRIVDDWEWDHLIRPLFQRRLGLRGQEYRLVGHFKQEMASHWDSLVESANPRITVALRPRFLGEWQSQRATFGYVILSEIHYRLLEALRSHPDLSLGDLKTLITDEYQDLNACDLACLNELTKRGVTLIAVGDDDQSIYSFRKAHPAGIREFPQAYSGASDYPLTINHRCGRRILDWAAHVIGQDLDRGAKAAVRPGDNNGEGTVAYLDFNREADEAAGIIRIVRWLRDAQHVPLREILILTRTSLVAKPIRQALEDASIPFQDPDALLEHLRTPVMRELLSVLWLLADRSDSMAWWALLHHTRRVTATHVDALYAAAAADGSRFGATILRRHEDGILATLIGNAGASRVSEVLQQLERLTLPEEGPWGAWIVGRIADGQLPACSDEAKTLLKEIDGMDSPRSLKRYLAQVWPLTKDLASKQQGDALRIMTMVASKGLTVGATIVAGCEDGIVPFPKGELNEERRMLYVAMTRSRQYLYITRARRRQGVTARVGRSNVSRRRSGCQFLEGGPVNNQDGTTYLNSLGA